MNARYHDALDYLYGFVNFEHKRVDQYSAENISLARPARLLSLLGDPHRSYPSLHIAGTKGKGSVSAMCASALRAAGLTVGLYTSPHLQEFRDRIRVLSPADGQGRISEEQFTALIDRLKPAAAEVPGLTWFELVTAIGFLHFAQQQVDVAVVEVGLGGRLDATNLLQPLVSVVTALSLDHVNLLGDTVAEIAAEKGGIIKPGVPVVMAPQPDEALAPLLDIAREKEARRILVGRHWKASRVPSPPQGPGPAAGQRFVVTRSGNPDFIPPDTLFDLALSGRHQKENALVALAALDQVRSYFPELTLPAVKEGLSTVRWPGRLQLLARDSGSPALLVDCAHNVHSAETLAYALTHDYRYEKLFLVLGMTVDKDVAGILEVLLPLTGYVVLTQSSHPRAADPAELLELARQLGYEAQGAPTVPEAVMAARRFAGPDDLICVSGSIFVVGDLLNQWESLQSQFAAPGREARPVHLETVVDG